MGLEPNTSRKKLWWIIGGGMVIVLIAGVSLFMLLMQKGTYQSESATADLFYGVMENAAKRPLLKVSMYRETYANKADAATKQNIGSITSSVSEADNRTNKYRTVFAHNFLGDPKVFTFGRCIDGVEYDPIYSGQSAPTSLSAVVPYLDLAPKGLLHDHGTPAPVSPCINVGVYPAPTLLVAGRLSDGVIPVHLTDAQAKKWAAEVRGANLFTIKDEGKVQKDGKELRKISLTPNDEQKVSTRLYDIFYTAANIDAIKNNPKALWRYQFASINPVNSGSVGGYYLIDEKAKLPVYSELYGTNPDKKINESEGAGRNIARTKQSYDFESRLTITTATPLEFLN